MSVIYEKRILELEEKLDYIYDALIYFANHKSCDRLGSNLYRMTERKKPTPVKEPACLGCSDCAMGNRCTNS